ncbi:MAG: hypothetical protein V4689_01040 [Verrucomicrobiota bacterium]
MKPNLVILQPAHTHLDSLIEEFCESFCDSHYVYLVRPCSALRDDSPGGVRFLSHPLDRLPAFGRVDTAIAVADADAMDRLREVYPDSQLAVWHPGETGEVPDPILSLLRPTVVHGTFGESSERDFARAI